MIMRVCQSASKYTIVGWVLVAVDARVRHDFTQIIGYCTFLAVETMPKT